MRYKKKQVKIPADMQIGCKVGVIGEGYDTFTITDILRKDGDVTDVLLSCGCREPLCKIYLIRDLDHHEAMKDQTSWIEVAIGECDFCGNKFPDSCAYQSNKGDKNSMICYKCYDDNNGLKVCNVPFD